MKGIMTLKCFVINIDTKFHENPSSSSLAETLEQEDKYDSLYTVLIHACHRNMIE
jgi:hypothetical protein